MIKKRKRSAKQKRRKTKQKRDGEPCGSQEIPSGFGPDDLGSNPSGSAL